LIAWLGAVAPEVDDGDCGTAHGSRKPAPSPSPPSDAAASAMAAPTDFFTESPPVDEVFARRTETIRRTVLEGCVTVA
jgi:hypothetical protein